MKLSPRIKRTIFILIGENEEFELVNQLFNSFCFIVGFLYMISLPIDYINGMAGTVTIINFTFSGIVGILYYFSRFRKIYKTPIIIFFLLIFTSLSIDFFLNAGSEGCVIYFYYGVLALIYFLTQGARRIALIVLLVINVPVLLYLDYRYPEWIVPYADSAQKLSDLVVSFIFSLVVVASVVYIARRFYDKEKKNTIDIIKKYRESSMDLRNELDTRLTILTVRERSVFKLIIEGQTNKEIADHLNISLGTVKTHVNNIYKKLGVSKRTEAIDMINENNLAD